MLTPLFGFSKKIFLPPFLKIPSLRKDFYPLFSPQGNETF
jgi:hypothetical protein